MAEGDAISRMLDRLRLSAMQAFRGYAIPPVTWRLLPQPWHSRSGGGAVHSIKPGLPPWRPHAHFRVRTLVPEGVRWSSCAILLRLLVARDRLAMHESE